MIIMVQPSREPDGRKAYTTRGQLFDAQIGERSLVRRSTTPFCDAARVLLADGVDPATRIAMRRAGQDYDALRSTVGAAAGLTVKDNRGKPVFANWQPFTHPVSPPMRQNEGAATQVA